jgi:hypothetical protein
MPVSEELKRGRFGEALKGLPLEKAQILRLLIGLLSEFIISKSLLMISELECIAVERCEKALVGITNMLVDEQAVNGLIPVVHCIMQSPDAVFGNTLFLSN